MTADLARPFYLGDYEGNSIEARFATEDDAHDYCDATYGPEAWNNTVILMSYEEPEDESDQREGVL